MMQWLRAFVPVHERYDMREMLRARCFRHRGGLRSGDPVLAGICQFTCLVARDLKATGRI
jgi:hypothetical protein